MSAALNVIRVVHKSAPSYFVYESMAGEVVVGN
jgi:hypothetical protein